MMRTMRTMLRWMCRMGKVSLVTALMLGLPGSVEAAIPVVDAANLIENAMSRVQLVLNQVNTYRSYVLDTLNFEELLLGNLWVYPEVMAGEYNEEISARLGETGPTLAYSSPELGLIMEELLQLEGYPLYEPYQGTRFGYANHREWKAHVAARMRLTGQRTLENLTLARGQLVRGIVGLLRLKAAVSDHQGAEQQARLASVLRMFSGEEQMSSRAIGLQQQNWQVVSEMVADVEHERLKSTGRTFLAELAEGTTVPARPFNFGYR